MVFLDTTGRADVGPPSPVSDPAVQPLPIQTVWEDLRRESILAIPERIRKGGTRVLQGRKKGGNGWVGNGNATGRLKRLKGNLEREARGIVLDRDSRDRVLQEEFWAPTEVENQATSSNGLERGCQKDTSWEGSREERGTSLAKKRRCICMSLRAARSTNDSWTNNQPKKTYDENDRLFPGSCGRYMYKESKFGAGTTFPLQTPPADLSCSHAQA